MTVATIEGWLLFKDGTFCIVTTIVAATIQNQLKVSVQIILFIILLTQYLHRHEVFSPTEYRAHEACIEVAIF